MTINDVNNLFDLLYDNAKSLSAPALEIFEKSLFLTQAYREIVKEIAPEFEQTEKRRRELGRLIVNYKVDYNSELNATYSNKRLSPVSKIFPLPEALWYIYNERLFITATDSIGIIPKTHDEYNRQILNPYKTPNARKAWRLDYTGDDDTQHIVEIVYNGNPVAYQARYLKKPSAIILDTLPEGYEIDGESAQTTSLEISSEYHEAIVKRAVLLATEAYKQNNLESKMALTNKDN